MTTMRFRSTVDSTIVHCMGLNHNDHGKSGECPSCGTPIVKLDNGRIRELRTRTLPSGFQRTDYACWSHTHECEAERQARWQAATKISLDRGDLIHDQHVTVTKGRKFAKGATGTIFWVGIDSYSGGMKLGVKLDHSDEKIFIVATNVTATNQLTAEPVDDLTARVRATVKPDVGSRRVGSHAGCDHEATPAARAKCRKARTSS